jgi:hypothetical protein
MSGAGRPPHAAASSGNTSAALPIRPTDFASPALVQRSIIASASSSVWAFSSQIAGADAEIDPRLVAFHGQAAGPGHDRGQRLRAAHAAKPAVRIQRPFRSPP